MKKDYLLTKVELIGDGKLQIYSGTTARLCTISMTNYSYFFVGTSLTLLLDATPASAWPDNGDALALVELDSSRHFKITF